MKEKDRQIKLYSERVNSEYDHEKLRYEESIKYTKDKLTKAVE